VNPALQFLAYLATGVFILLSFMLLVTMRQSVRVAGSKQWMWGVVMVVVGVILGTLPQSVPDWLSRVPSNALVLGGWLQVAVGTYVYRTERTLSVLPVGLLVLACLLLFGSLTYLAPHFTGRVLLFTSLQFCIFAFHAWTVLLGGITQRQAPWVRNRHMVAGHWLLFASACGVMLNVTLRASYAWNNMSAEMPSGGLTQTTLYSYATGVFLWSSVFVGLMLIMTTELEFELRNLANTDALTKTLNRRGLIDAVAKLPANEAHSLLSFDLDHFKAINDEFGHEAGDQVIQLFVASARRVLPASAIIARTGGEEFCIILPYAGELAGAAAAALRADFAKQSITLNHGRAHSASAGLVSAVAGAFNLAELQRRADEALYRAKQSGRDQVVLA
jgi:diguanylate cyclase (GGDEF)-like protein